MKNIFKYTLLTVFTATLFTSCSEDFLDAEPTQFLTDDQIREASENNPDVVAGSMSGIYTLMFEAETGGTTSHDDFGQKGYDIYSDMACGDMALSVSTYGWYRSSITEFQAMEDYTDLNNYKIWRYYYRIIRSANSVISALGGNDVIPEVEENRHLLGQAKAMRAYGYYYLTQFFTESYELGASILPVYIDPTQPNQPKSTTEEVYGLIIQDLTDAISLLDDFTRTQKSQINKPVAQALLAYTYGAIGGTENYAMVKTLTSDIINNGGFTLMTANEVVYDFEGDEIGGFNDANTPGWMWGVDLTSDNNLDLVSWWGQMDYFTYSYQGAGDSKAIDSGLYAAIPDNDVRKGQFYFDESSSHHLSAMNKFYPPIRKASGQRTVTTDYVYMRIAEMYLLNAEAAAMTGDEATARQSLKVLLNERLDDVSYVDDLSGDRLSQEIYLQTRIEFYAEGKSYLAMKRNKATVTRGDNHLSNVGVPIPYNDDRLTFEIPQSEIQNNPFISL